jgi:hypothetical protein
LRFSDKLIIGFIIFVAGWIFQLADSLISGNAGTVLQLAGTLSIIVGIAITAIGFFEFIRKRFSSPTKT